MSNDPVDPKEHVPGEKKPGKFHYNPVNMSGKHEEPGEDEAPKQTDARSKSRDEAVHRHRERPGKR